MGTGGGAGKVSPLEHQSSRDSKPTSPLHDPPSYNQAMKGTGVVLTPSYVMRSRSLSESVSSHSGHPPVPILVTRPLKPVNSKDSASASPLSSSQSHKSQRAQSSSTARSSPPKPHHEGSPSGVAHSDKKAEDTGQSQKTEPDRVAQDDAVGATVSDLELPRVQDSEEGEFARHVRGTSTPIDVSVCIPDQSSPDKSAGDGLGEQVEHPRDENGKRGSLRREDAFEAMEVDHTEVSVESVESMELGETS